MTLPAPLCLPPVHAWAMHPTSERIVEDISRYPLVIDKIVEHKGGLVPDFEMQHAGCSKRKRKASGASRLYTPSPEVAAIGRGAPRDAARASPEHAKSGRRIGRVGLYQG